jgi:hypothetical protein
MIKVKTCRVIYADLTLREILGKTRLDQAFFCLDSVWREMLLPFGIFTKMFLSLSSLMLFLLAIALVAGSHLVHYWKKVWFRIASCSY